MPRSWPARSRVMMKMMKIMTRSVFVAALSASAALALAGQEPRPFPPDLGAVTYASAVADQLALEMKECNDQARAATGAARLILEAAVNYRVLAAELIAVGNDAGPDGSLTLIAGLRLARGREAIDHTLDMLPALEETIETSTNEDDDPAAARADAVSAALEAFNLVSVARAAEIRTTDARALDRALATILRPLAEAVEALEGAPVVDHWIPASSVRLAPVVLDEADAPPAAPAPPAIELDALAARIDSAPLPEPVRAELRSILDYLRRGEAFPEYRPTVRDYAALLGQGLDLADAASARLDEQAQQQMLTRVGEAVRLFRNPQTRRAGERLLRRMAGSAAYIERLATLMDLEDAGDAAWSATIFQSAEEVLARAEDEERARRRLSMLNEALDQMIGSRRLDRSGLTGELRGPARQLWMECDRAEASILEYVTRLGGEDSPDVSDADLEAALAQHRQAVGDLRRLARLPEWTARIRRIRPPAADAFRGRMRRLAARLLDPARRAETVEMMGRFQRELDAFARFPFEDELRAADTVAITATGARQEELLGVIERERIHWAEAWARGEADDPGAHGRLAQLRRLTRSMADLAALIELGDRVHILNRWTPLELEPRAVLRMTTDLPNRLKLATVAALDEDAGALAEQLDRIDRDGPVATLLGRLAQGIGQAVRALPGGSRSVLGQSIHPPPAEAWLAERRLALAQLGRYLLELEEARATGRDEEAAALRTFVNALAGQLLEVLGE